MTTSRIFHTSVTLACAAAVGLTGYFMPLNNWDLIGYIASALGNSGLTGPELHDATYSELRRAIPPERFDLLTQSSPYARGVFADPEALQQQLPFYRIRVLYILTLQALAHPMQGLAQASYVVSATSAAGLAVLTGLMARRHAPMFGWPLAAAGLVLTLYLGGVADLARLSTPDAAFSLAALAALALFYHARGAAMAIVAFLPLIRTDAIVLAVLVFALLLIERDRDLRHYGALAVSAGLYLWLNSAYENYGHAILFNFSFIPGQRTPYPETLEILREPAAYIDVYMRRTAGMVTRWVPWILLVAGAAAVIERKSTGRVGPLGRLALLAVAYVVLHFLAFPLGATRHYAFALILCCIYTMHVSQLFIYKT